MIKVNLLPVKRKKKPKPIPSFIVTMVIITIITIIVMANLAFFFNSRLSKKRTFFKNNESKIVELKQKIKEVENFEQLNKTIEQRNSIIEQLRKNQSMPVRLLDEANNLLPDGVWLHEMTVSGGNVSMEGYAFANSDIVTYVDNMKNSQIFTEVYLQESKSTNIENTPLYMFKLTFKVKV
jgi:type IV pilus assembly protein PilN